MLSYKHGFHAGNHADVIKHLVITIAIEKLQKKDNGFLYLETHSGAGLYDLLTKEAQLNKEYLAGISTIYDSLTSLPIELQKYVDIVRSFNSKKLRYYPGSPCIAESMLRKQDRLVFAELHSKEVLSLQENLAKYNNTTVLKDNGFNILKAYLPPKERRGMIVIDPSYEMKTDYKEVVNALKFAYKRFSTGCYVLWYPILERQLHLKMLEEIKEITDKHLTIEFTPDTNITTGMYGSGVIILNPPYMLDDAVKYNLKFLQSIFHQMEYKIA